MGEHKIIAIVSGKGGSGKTMLATMMAKVFDDSGKKVLLVDSDCGTGGLTFYLGLNEIKNISVGLSNLEKSSSNKVSLKHLAKTPLVRQEIQSFKTGSFIGIGDYKYFLKLNDPDKREFYTLLGETLHLPDNSLEIDVTIVDCRGGIDNDTLAVCSMADDILIVAETDTTSFQATQHLVETLYDNDLSIKLRGFFINKVFDDPSTLARTGTSTFKSQFLSAIPFDIDATKSFLVGEIPDVGSTFGRQIWLGTSKCYPELVNPPSGTVLKFSDFNGLSIRDFNSVSGGVFLSFIGIVFTILGFLNISLTDLRYDLVQSFVAISLVAILSGIEPARRSVGKAISFAYNTVIKLFLGRRK